MYRCVHGFAGVCGACRACAHPPHAVAAHAVGRPAYAFLRDAPEPRLAVHGAAPQASPAMRRAHAPPPRPPRQLAKQERGPTWSLKAQPCRQSRPALQVLSVTQLTISLRQCVTMHWMDLRSEPLVVLATAGTSCSDARVTRAARGSVSRWSEVAAGRLHSSGDDGCAALSPAPQAGSKTLLTADIVAIVVDLYKYSQGQASVQLLKCNPPLRTR